eukprot:ctg_71.g18
MGSRLVGRRWRQEASRERGGVSGNTSAPGAVTTAVDREGARGPDARAAGSRRHGRRGRSADAAAAGRCGDARDAADAGSGGLVVNDE